MPETADLLGPSPKRRRIDRAPISPGQIAQTNATLSHFMGQRQNRWMQDYTSSSNLGRSNTATSGQSTSNGQPSVPSAHAEGRAGRTGNERQRSVHEEARANGQERASSERATDVTRATANPTAATPTVVAYENPLVDILQPTTSSTDRHTGIHHTSLPSPAPSDENSGSASATGQSGVQPPKRGPGRPRKHPLPVLASSGPPATTTGPGRGSGSGTASASLAVAIAPAPEQQQQQLRSPALTVNSTDISRPQTQRSSSTHNNATTDGGQLSQPAMANSNSSLTSGFLKARVDGFRAAHLKANPGAQVDEGRLQLLGDAVAPSLDGFYIALSQLHALAACDPSALPDAVRNLPPNCWKSVDDLICSNKDVSPLLVAFLADFPVPRGSLRSSPPTPGTYNAFIAPVANFLYQLPARWHNLANHCQGMQAPPLAQDLSMGLNMSSVVLQSVAFRAVARLIWPSDNDRHVLDHLEQLHQFDQQAWARGYVRLGDDIKAGYWAFQRMRNAWMQWWQAAQTSQTPLRAFHYTLVLDALAVFAPAKAAEIRAERQGTVPSNPAVPFTLQQTSTLTPTAPVQQQQQRPQHPHQHFNPLSAANMRGFSQSPMNMQAAPLTLPAVPPPKATHPGQAIVWMPPQQHAQGSRYLVFPHDHDTPRAQPTEPNPFRSALHQAHLRSPVPEPLKINDEAPQLYRYVSHLALSPQRLDNTMLTTSFTFELSEDDLTKIPKTNPPSRPGELATRMLSEESQLYRLRCCTLPPTGLTSDSAWALADTCWPRELYLSLNGKPLEMRRPLHHKKSLPIDLSDMVQSGNNVIDVVIHRRSNDDRAFDVSLAVEVVGVIAHSTLLNNIEKHQTIPAADTKASIQKALTSSGTRAADDDDFAIVSTSMTIKMFDPFSGSKIFDTPVRGASCTHKDCFDLETLLSQCKRDKPGAPTAVDSWRCPLCRSDVRPQEMVRDAWLVEVREKLEAQGKLDTRAILVEADGSWKPKPEERTGVRNASMERDEEEGQGAAKRAREDNGETMPAPKKAKKVIEVIELD